LPLSEGDGHAARHGTAQHRSSLICRHETGV
jgi:hypothetical protein